KISSWPLNYQNVFCSVGISTPWSCCFSSIEPNHPILELVHFMIQVNTSGMRAPPPSREPSRASGALYELTPTRKLATKSPGMIHIGTAHDTSGEIVPPSPMKKDFTSEPPLHAQR
ncbi:unnamed protein product, partial [Owenia fusiformis]